MPVATKTVQMVVWQLTVNNDDTVTAHVRVPSADPVMPFPSYTVEYANSAEAPVLEQLIDVTFAPAA